MSSTYSGDRSVAASVRTISDIFPAAPLRDSGFDNRASHLTTASSTTGSALQRNGDLDLDAFFKRLDKYTAEMEEVEARLRRDRSTSEHSEAFNLKSFSLELDRLFDRDTSATLLKPDSPAKFSVASKYSFDELETKHAEALHVGANGDMHLQKRRPSSTSVADPMRTSLNYSDHEENLAVTALDADEQLETDDKKDCSASERSSVRERSSAYSQSQPERRSLALAAPSSKLDCTVLDKVSKEIMLIDPEPNHGEELGDTLGKGHQDEGEDEMDFEDDDENSASAQDSLTLPPRTSSKNVASISKFGPDTIAPVETEDAVEDQPSENQTVWTRRHREPTTAARQKSRNAGFWSPPVIDIAEDDDMPPVPGLSDSASTATLKTSPPLTPVPHSSLCSPNEDQLRRELESFALHDGPQVLAEVKYKKRRPPMLNLADSEDESTATQSVSPGSEQPQPDETGQPVPVSVRPHPRRKKSIFSIFERRSPVEKLIDMYFDDAEEQKPPARRFSMRSRKSFSASANSPKSPPVPPLPSTPLLPTMPMNREP